MYGIDAVVLDAQTGEVVEGNDVEGVLAIGKPWPGMARTCLGDHQRYMATYLTQYPGYYFTGDTVYRDKDGKSNKHNSILLLYDVTIAIGSAGA